MYLFPTKFHNHIIYLNLPKTQLSTAIKIQINWQFHQTSAHRTNAKKDPKRSMRHVEEETVPRTRLACRLDCIGRAFRAIDNGPFTPLYHQSSGPGSAGV